VRKGKGELFDYLRVTNGTAFIMWDYEYLQTMSAGLKQIVKYGTGEGAVIGSALHSDTCLGVKFDKGYAGTINTKLAGDYNLPNVLAAVAVGKFFNVPDALIGASLEGYTPSNSRSQLVKKGSNTIILDAYNANPSSMKLAIENFANSKGESKILMLGAMAELGTDSIKEHQDIVKQISKYQWKDVCLVGGDFLKFDHTFRGMNNADEAGDGTKQKLSNVFILVKGSRSTGMEKVLEYI
jgi:UDP-N-acetylmuramoyl-tripeptide--D-alanyl-D-alanine ligase